MWGRWLSGAYGAPQWRRWLGFLPGIAWITLLALLVRASFLVTQSMEGDPAAKARILGETISEVMHLLVFALAFLVLYVGAMLVLSWRYRWSNKLPKAEGRPPYR